jgi:trigger factor
MQFEVKEVNNVKRHILVTVPAEDLQKIESDILKDVSKNATIPGFRKGRAPMGLVKKNYAGFIQKELLETAVSRGYQQAMAETDLKVVSRGEIQDVNFTDTKTDLTFTIEVEVQPEFELKKYKGLEVEREKVVVTEEMVNEALENIRQNFATAKAVDEAKEGNIVTITLQQLGEGDAPIIGRKYDDIKVKLGAGEFDPEMEKQLIGIKVGEERILTNTIETPDGQKRTERYSAKATAIEELELPELNDDLAKNLGEENINTLDELCEYLKEQMTKRMQDHAEQHMTQHLIDELLKENPFDVPDSMVENYLDYVVNDIRSRNPKAKIDEATVRQQYRVEAIHAIRWHLLKDKIREVENITASDEEAIERIKKAGFGEEETKKFIENKDLIKRVKDDIVEEKVLNFLKEHAKITEVEPGEHKH